MAGPVGPEVMVREARALAGDLRGLTGPVDRQVKAVLSATEWASVGSVYLTGEGDSAYATQAAAMAFQAAADVVCLPMGTLDLIEYGAGWARHAGPERTLVVAASASGRTPRVLEAVTRARDLGALTVAVTGAPGSAVTGIADHSVVVELPGRERSPGIRTYQATLLALLLLAVGLGAARARMTVAEATGWQEELAGLAAAVDATSRAIAGPCREVATAIAAAPTIAMVAGGPNLGTARYGAAKVIEASGVPATALDLEEWWHVGRFAAPVDMPVFVVAAPGRSHGRAVDLAALAARLGRRVVAVAHHDDTEVARHAMAVLPVHGAVREELSPLLYHLFAGQLAAALAERLGRSPFQSSRA